jgi:transposase
LWLRYEQQGTSHPVRAYRERAAGVKVDRQATVEVRVDEEALAAAASRFGWRLYATNQPREQLSLEQAVLAYRSEYLVERGFGRLKGRPLSLAPMYVQRDDHATGLIRLLSITLRVLTLMEFVGRRHLALDNEKIAGLYAGNPKRNGAAHRRALTRSVCRRHTDGDGVTVPNDLPCDAVKPGATADSGNFRLFLGTLYEVGGRFCRTALKIVEP